MNPKTPAKKPASPEDDVVARARRKVQRAIEEAERDHRNKLLRRRIELATAGVHAYETGKFSEAARDYLGYLKILEDWKGVGHGGLTPSLFDPKKDAYETLLISAVCWDLAKLFDKTAGADKQRDFRMFLEKYVIFSKGTAHQPLSAESLRKYIANNKCIHKAEFKNAYKMLGGDQCFIATSLIDVTEPETIVRLRCFRDQRLSQYRAGRAFIRWYYKNGPTLAARVDTFPETLRRAMGGALDIIALFSTTLSGESFRSGPDGTQTGCPKN